MHACIFHLIDFLICVHAETPAKVVSLDRFEFRKDALVICKLRCIFICK